jgi:hypothetical protein
LYNLTGARVRCDPAGHQTAFGKWISMRTAFARLDGLAGGPGRLALVVFDSAPAMALMALGPALAPAPTNELDYRTQGTGTAICWTVPPTCWRPVRPPPKIKHVMHNIVS